MKTSSSTLALTLSLSLCLLSHSAIAKDFKNMTVKNGKMTPEDLKDIRTDVEKALENFDGETYANLVQNPKSAKTEAEKLAVLAAREYFIMVDRSGSMTESDEDPTGAKQTPWTRWDSARVAAEGIIELALSLDRDNKVELIAWSGMGGHLKTEKTTVTKVSEISAWFKTITPTGSTPLAEALNDLYTSRLAKLLEKEEPFTVIVLTDGAPDDIFSVKKFFKDVITQNKLDQAGKDTLAAFSLVQMGDHPAATQFLQDLDDNLVKETGIKADIVDTKKDNFIFGTGQYSNLSGVGPLPLLLDAIYD